MDTDTFGLWARTKIGHEESNKEFNIRRFWNQNMLNIKDSGGPIQFTQILCLASFAWEGEHSELSLGTLFCMLCLQWCILCLKQIPLDHFLCIVVLFSPFRVSYAIFFLFVLAQDFD